MDEFQHDIDHLILLYLEGKASKKQMNALNYWLSNSQENKATFDAIQKIWSSEASMEVVSFKEKGDKIWAASKERKQESKSTIHPTWYGYGSWVAVVIVLLLFTGIGVFLGANKDVALENKITWIKKENPKGQKSTHQLPDGTKVWLNAMSSMEYPSIFSDSIRKVKITGEAYFNVVSNPSQPFIVESKSLKIEALGTAFNVKTFPDESTHVVSLMKGKVRVSNFPQNQSSLLDPGFEIVAENEFENLSLRRIDFENSFGWKEGILIFNGDDFFTFVRLIERWFGVNITVKGNPPSDWNIRAKYYNESLTNVLRDIGFNKNLKFELNKKELFLEF
ncbi:FecR family protein [Cyclobacterium amurskyense]|uniref:Anti-FecI sigma factor, FecR n=1 Tax=Cyclobacterium amurskyense TaxID=320787 RepID=A0A0H4PKG8_9BACT|nr:FecR family protein [Cyclobacterium amurskyense]AKP53478.1 hypothetical protein CA2015_4125 [Cyclobacterium amurskyense]